MCEQRCWKMFAAAVSSAPKGKKKLTELNISQQDAGEVTG